MSQVNLPPVDEEWFSGDDKDIAYTINGIADLTGYDIIWRLFNGLSTVFSKTTGAGEIVITTNLVTVTVNAADTDGLEGNYTYECEGTSPGGKVVTLAWGSVKLKHDKIIV